MATTADDQTVTPDPPQQNTPAASPAGKKVGGWGHLKRELHQLIPDPVPPLQANPLQAGNRAGVDGHAIPDNRPKHLAQLRDDSLRELLIEAFKIAEIRFNNFDKDSAGALMFPEVKRDIAMAGFYDEHRLTEIWRMCDVDRSNMIDFSEFLYMLYMWQYANEIATGSATSLVPAGGYASAYLNAKKLDLYCAFFSFKTNREIVFKAFSKMEGYYKQYDADNNRMFSLAELNTFMRNHLPFVFQAPKTASIISAFFPPTQPNKEIHFHQFMALLYTAVCEFAPDRIKGIYKKHCVPGQAGLDLDAPGLLEAFTALEQDFQAFDADGNGRLELHEVTEGLDVMGKKHTVDFFGRLQFYMNHVDLDRSGDLDFFQFVLLAYHTCQDGSYSKLIINARNGR